METNLLLDPNVAYVILVTAGMLLILALITPGTGFLEAGAVIALVFVAYDVLNLPLNPWAILALLAGFLPFVWALFTRKMPGLYLVLAILLFELGSVFFWQRGVNPLLALLVVITTSLFLWFSARKSIEAHNLPLHQNLENLIGMVGEAHSDIHPQGSAQVGGELWSVESDEPIVSGERVQVLSRDGFVLKVKRV